MSTVDDYLDVANNGNKWSKNGFGVPVAKSSGKFSREESERVRKAVEDYCAAKQIPTARLCAECEHKAELKGAWMEISKCLPHRSVQSVYRHGIRQLHPFKRGHWSEEECQILADLVQRLGKKWSTIQGKLNRSADSCRDKYREMSDEYVKGRWKDSETEELKRVIRETLNLDHSVDMRDIGRMVEEQGMQIPWSTISKRMGQRSRLSCFKKWQKMSGVMIFDERFDEPPSKRPKIVESYAEAPTAGAAAALAVAQHQGDYDIYSAKIAADTVEAVDLPDTDVLVHANVRDISDVRGI